MRNIWVIAISILCFAGCSSKEQAPDPGASEAPAAEKRTLDLSQAGSVSGRVRFEGSAPETRDLSVRGNPECAIMHAGGEVKQEEFLVKDGNVQNAFVYVKSGLEGYDFSAPSEPATIDNRRCVYVPHVLGAQVNQKINVLNSDPTLHNVHAFAKKNKSWNIGLPLQGVKQVKTFSQPEVMIKLKCDVHPWMTGYVGVLPHPYFQVTGEDGAFNLPNLPPGTYEIEAWHEKLGTVTRSVTLNPGEQHSVDLLLIE